VKKIIFVITLLTLLTIYLPANATAATLTLSPNSKSVNVGEELEVVVNINTEGQDIILAEALINFDDSLEFVSETKGDFLPDYNFNQLDNTLRIAQTYGPSGSPKSGQGVLTNLVFTAKTPGITNLTFDCRSETDTVIGVLDPSAEYGVKNILNCASLTNGSYTINPADNNGGEPLPTRQPGGPAQTIDKCGGAEGSDNNPADYNECKECLSKKDHKWTVVGCISSSPGGFTQSTLRILMSIVGGLSFLALLYGGGLLLTSRGNPEKLESGKGVIVKAIIGLFLTLFAVFILRFIGIEILSLPGFN
jgi:hypothetical protein